jgi:hypothetical protein
MRPAGKEIKLKITEVGARMSVTSVNETSRKRNQAQDYGSGSKNVDYFRK